MYEQSNHHRLRGVVTTVGWTLAILALAALVVEMRVWRNTASQASSSVAPAAAGVARTVPAADSASSGCRLAVSYVTSTGHPAKLAGAFLAYPGSGLSTTSFSVDTPAGSSSAAWTYDAPLHRWLPTLPGAVAPDGHAYIADLTSDS